MIADDIARYLHELQIAEFDATGTTGDTFIQTLPDAPDDCIGVYMRGGTAPRITSRFEGVSVQVIVRGGQDPREPLERAQRIYAALHGLMNRALVTGGVWIVMIKAQQAGAIALGQDTSRRHEFALNFEVYLKNDSRTA